MRAKQLVALPVVASFILSGSAPAVWADDWMKLTQDGAEAFTQSNYGQAERLFKLALREAETYGDHDLRLSTSLTNLGVVYKAHAQIAKAEPLFEKAVAIQQNVLGPDNFDVIASSAKLCQFYISRGHWAKADPLCAHVMGYARTHKNSSEHELELAVLLDGLSRSYGSKVQSEELCRTALAIRERALPKGHMAIASSCDSVAKLYTDSNRTAEAEPYYRRSFEITQNTLGISKPETLNRLDCLAQCLLSIGQTREAEKLYRTGMETCDHTYGKRSGYTAKMQIGLAGTLTRQGRYSEAAPLLSDALQTQEALQGPQNTVLTPILDAYADALDKSNRHAEASKIQQRAKAIRGWM